MRFTISNALDTVTAGIGVGQSLSGDLALGGLRLAAIQMPAAWTAASLTFQASVDGAVWSNLYDAGGVELAISAASNRLIVADLAQFAGLPYLRVRSGTAASPVSQAADRSLNLILRSV